MGVSNKYDAQLAIGSQSNITIHLEDDGFSVEAGLDEVTITAPSAKNSYTSVITLKKVQVLKHDMIMREGIKDVYSAVQRLVPSAQLLRDSDGGRHLIIARGRNSFRAPEPPIFIVDGVPVEAADAENTLAVEDVAEISVDRDGTSYGSRGANGVVIIRTMKGSDN